MKIELQAHIFFENYSLEDVVKVMNRNNIGAVALLRYNEDNYAEIIRASKRLSSDFNVEEDDLLIKIQKEDDKRYFIRGIEVTTDDNFHFVILGYKGTAPNRYAEETIESALEKEAFIFFDHPYVLCNNVRKEVSKEQENKLIRLCISYSDKLALEWNGYCKPLLRKILGGKDVNGMILSLSDKLLEAGINTPVVADTDLHARNLRLLEPLGTAYMETDADLTSGTNFIRSLTRNVFARNYKNNYQCPSTIHFIEAFGIPVLLNSYRNRG